MLNCVIPFLLPFPAEEEEEGDKDEGEKDAKEPTYNKLLMPGKHQETSGLIGCVIHNVRDHCIIGCI